MRFPSHTSRTFLAGFLVLAAGSWSSSRAAHAANPDLSRYFQEETRRVEQAGAAQPRSLAEWQQQVPRYRAELQEMLGLLPWPERTDLRPEITGTLDHAEFTVEKLHFQSLPGLYVTANLYVPKSRPVPLPAILYLCGHSRQTEDGVSFGNKTGYQHHGAWFARHGYVCLMIDTIQLGELSGLHHGMYRQGMWWWNARGYTPAGVEAWNAIRALDYLQSRPEVDGERLGMTGRSGGGAYTWYAAALDERVKVAVPVAGVTDLHNHVVDGVIKGHCDCMFMVNTFCWDYSRLAALLAPRPLLFANSDKDPIFPLEGVLRVHRDVAAVYRLHGAADRLGLLITEGPHRDTQDLQVPAFRWFNRFLRGQDPLITVAAEKLFRPAELKVFATLPADERTTTTHEFFVPPATPAVPKSAPEWAAWRDATRRELELKSFAGWPEAAPAATPVRQGEEVRRDLRVTRWEYESQSAVPLPLWVVQPANAPRPAPVRLQVLDQQGWDDLLATAPELFGTLPAIAPPASKSAAADLHRELLAQAGRGEVTLVYLPPRGIGPTRWEGEELAQTHLRRRFMLLGQTPDGMRVWDIRQAIETLRHPAVLGAGTRVILGGERDQAVNAVYASLFSEHVTRLELVAPPRSHQGGPDYLNVLRYLDVPQAVALAAERVPVHLARSNPDDWSWARATARVLGWPADRLSW